MCLGFVFLLVTRLAAWLRLSRRQVDVEDRRDLDPAPPARGPAAAAAAPPEAELGGPAPARGPARRDTESPPPRAAAAGHPGHHRGLAPRHRPAPPGGAVHARQDRPAGHPPDRQGPRRPASAAASASARNRSASLARCPAAAARASAATARCSAAARTASTSTSAAVGSPTVAIASRSRSAIPDTRSASARSDRSSSVPVSRAIVTGCSMSAALIIVPASSAARRRRSRHAVVLLCSRPSQYSGGRPGPAVRAAGSRQPGYLQVVRVISLFAIQAFATIVAVSLALAYSAWK
jgi:hypothetical protein